MNFGFDAKRNFHNNTGLGNYSRTLIKGLAQYFPEHHYFLFNPKPTPRYAAPPAHQVHEVLPQQFIDKTLSALWRSWRVTAALKNLKIDLYHGLSHEIPIGLPRTGIPSVVTIHDLIFERYPNQFTPIDVRTYRAKFSYACKNADRIIAVSEQTKRDLIDFYKIADTKIDVCYQSCDPVFAVAHSAEQKQHVRAKYNLPDHFFLYVGSIIERKNLLAICEALHRLQPQVNVPLVVIGQGKKYKDVVKAYLHSHNLVQEVIFLSEHPRFKDADTVEMACVYQSAIALIYPSFFEGFGIPVLEALWSRVPVITSNQSCLPEVGGAAAIYVNPASSAELAAALKTVVGNETLRAELAAKGWEQAQHFTLSKCTTAVMNVYKKLL